MLAWIVSVKKHEVRTVQIALDPTVRENLGDASTSEKSEGMNSAIFRKPKSEARSLNSA